MNGKTRQKAINIGMPIGLLLAITGFFTAWGSSKEKIDNNCDRIERIETKQETTEKETNTALKEILEKITEFSVEQRAIQVDIDYMKEGIKELKEMP